MCAAYRPQTVKEAAPIWLCCLIFFFAMTIPGMFTANVLALLLGPIFLILIIAIILYLYYDYKRED